MEFTEVFLLLITLTLVKGSTSSGKTNENFILPSNCPKVCGNISIEYPFGIGNGCFYAAGFNLTCSYDFNPPRLFLWDGTIQVVGFDMKLREIQIESPYAILNADTESINTTLINIMNSPFSLYGQLESLYVPGNSSGFTNTNDLYVVGCNATANIVDLGTNSILDFCTSTCSTNTSMVDNGVMFGNGYCRISLTDLIFNQFFSLTIKLYRPNENKNNHMITDGSSDVIAAVICNECSPIYREDLQSFIKQENKTSAKAHLTWRINDRPSCEEARNYLATYACRSRNSDCYSVPADFSSFYSNDTIGYICQCSLGYHGNPYLPDGCQLDTNFTRIPAKDCPYKCGNITVPFPFGLKENCYRSQEFALSCNILSHPPTLLYDGYLEVKAISLEDGQVEFSPYETEFDEYFPSIEELTVYNWIVGYETCNIAVKNKSTFACLAQHSSCLDVKITNDYKHSTYRCKCMEGYEGNPYIQHGCQDINECNSSSHGCKGICINTEGSFNCTCPPGTLKDPVQGACIPQRKKILLLGVLVGACIGVGLLLLCITLFILTKKWKERNQKKIRQRNFHQNHGLLLQQLISINEHVKERTNIFSLEEIEKATNNFDETRVVGRGGHGTVYKGILPDQRVVAIKKSKIVEKSEIDQFINEVVVLSQINHRNVVKLFGCCLETEVPLLIYEFISNGTLSDHLHILQSESKLSWDDRLRIATESAEALAYLHSAASISIFHRDIKSSNILLDDTFKAKISDFGASRFIPLDQTHIVTAIQGTVGYLDPEYYQTGQLTEKSDVYSFGVILLELLTGKKPIYSTKTGSQQNLAINFLQTTREKMLFDLIEDHILQEGTEQELLEITSLIEMCLSLKGVERPTMKEIEYKLQGIRKTRIKKRGVYNPEGNEETECLLNLSGHSSSELANQINQENSRNYSLEKEFMQSQNYPR